MIRTSFRYLVMSLLRLKISSGSARYDSFYLCVFKVRGLLFLIILALTETLKRNGLERNVQVMELVWKEESHEIGRFG